MKIYEFHELIKKLDEGGWDIHGIELDRAHYDAASDLLAMYEHAYKDVMALFVFLTFLAKSTAEAEKERTSGELRRSFQSALQGSGEEEALVICDYFRYKAAPKDEKLHQLARSEFAGYFDWENYLKEERTDLRLLPHGRFVYLFREV